ncbi:hypothetical protein NUM_43330 [Actinocatenispora comari]|uniref:Uncharacterized protein n=1 Tax=Actinocatenispora comari TaxID=2807577 RepID=A0A8J4EPT8_9ACTN|nr:hypothetical protein NUM_43330 [Actinocatenispora comari]
MNTHHTPPAPLARPRIRHHHRPRPAAPQARRARIAVVTALAALWLLLPARCRANWRLLHRRPDAGAETTEVVIGIALAAAAALTVWHFLGPKLLAIAQNAMSGL